MVSVFKTDTGNAMQALEEMLAGVQSIPENSKEAIRAYFKKGFREGRAIALREKEERLRDIYNYLKEDNSTKPEDFEYFGFAIGYIFAVFKHRAPLDALHSEMSVSTWLAMMRGKHKSFKQLIFSAASIWVKKLENSDIPLDKSLAANFEKLKGEIEKLRKEAAA